MVLGAFEDLKTIRPIFKKKDHVSSKILMIITKIMLKTITQVSIYETFKELLKSGIPFGLFIIICNWYKFWLRWDSNFLPLESLELFRAQNDALARPVTQVIFISILTFSQDPVNSSLKYFLPFFVPRLFLSFYWPWDLTFFMICISIIKFFKSKLANLMILFLLRMKVLVETCQESFAKTNKF